MIMNAGEDIIAGMSQATDERARAGMTSSMDPARLVLRWDLDKTYLRTDFDTVRDLIRTAFEGAAKKRTVPGARALLRELASIPPAGIHILSGSPEQMRRVLEAKLRLDGIQWTSFVLKPSLGHLMKGRFRFVRDQVGYKLRALLESRQTAELGWDEILFGDDAEADAFIYSLYADICAGRVGNNTLMEVLRRAQVYEEDIPDIVRLADRIGKRDAVRRIFIHLDRISAPGVFDDFGSRVCPFYNYFQPALVLVEAGVLAPIGALRVGAEMVQAHSFTPDALIASYLELVRRKQLTRKSAELIAHALDEGERELGSSLSVIREFVSDVAALGEDLPMAPPAKENAPIDYVALFSRERARAREAKRRVQTKR